MCIQIQWTCRNLEEAREIARELVSRKYVACANIIPHVESIFLWENKIETAQEVKVLLKTSPKRFADVKAFIEANCSYEVPEVTKISLDETSPRYLEWVIVSTD